MIEAVASAKGMLMTNRRRVQPIGGLGVKQLQWCAARWPSFAWPRVQRLVRVEQVAVQKETA